MMPQMIGIDAYVYVIQIADDPLLYEAVTALQPLPPFSLLIISSL